MKTPWAVLVVFAVGACGFDPSPVLEERFGCKSTSECVSGHRCYAGVCTKDAVIPGGGGSGGATGGSGGNDGGELFEGDGGEFDAGLNTDAGPDDAGENDSGFDSGTFDAGISDAGMDSGTFDAGLDAGKVDGGSDSGIDAGPFDAGLGSWPGCLVVGPADLDGGPSGNLTTPLRNTLTGHLVELSARWDAGAVNVANPMLGDTSYNASDWESFFTDYFVTQGRPYTNDLRNFMGYATFAWNSPASRAQVQEGLSRALWKKFGTITAAYPSNLAAALVSDAGTRVTMNNVQRFFADMGGPGAGTSSATRGLWFSRIAQHVNQYPNWLKWNVILDGGSAPYTAAYRAQVWVALRDVAPLDACTRAGVTQTLALDAGTLGLWNATQPLFHDNRQMPNATPYAFANLLSAVPSSLFVVRNIFQQESLSNVSAATLEIAAYQGMNISTSAIGSLSENPFPADVPASLTETTLEAALWTGGFHGNDFVIGATPAIDSRRNALIARAGAVDNQYLRSNVGAAYFQGNPGALFSSTSLVFVTDTSRTLELAVVRFDAGFKEPMNQFLFMADLFTLDGGSLPFTRVFPDGGVTRALRPVGRNAGGRITSINTDAGLYTFTVDDGGFVQSYVKN